MLLQVRFCGYYVVACVEFVGKAQRSILSDVFDLFFGLIIMPSLIFLAPAHSWWKVSPAFTCLVTAYLYGCYFATRLLRLPQLILSRSYLRLAIIFAALLLLTYLLTLYPLPEMNFVIPSMSEYQTRVRNYNMAIAVWFMFFIILAYSLIIAFIKELYHRKPLPTTTALFCSGCDWPTGILPSRPKTA